MPLTLDDKITASAQNYSEYLAKNDLFEHSDGSNGYGENLFWFSSSKKIQNFQSFSFLRRKENISSSFSI